MSDSLPSQDHPAHATRAIAEAVCGKRTRGQGRDDPLLLRRHMACGASAIGRRDTRPRCDAACLRHTSDDGGGEGDGELGGLLERGKGRRRWRARRLCAPPPAKPAPCCSQAQLGSHGAVGTGPCASQFSLQRPEGLVQSNFCRAKHQSPSERSADPPCACRNGRSLPGRTPRARLGPAQPARCLDVGVRGGLAAS